MSAVPSPPNRKIINTTIVDSVTAKLAFSGGPTGQLMLDTAVSLWLRATPNAPCRFIAPRAPTVCLSLVRNTDGQDSTKTQAVNYAPRPHVPVSDPQSGYEADTDPLDLLIDHEFDERAEEDGDMDDDDGLRHRSKFLLPPKKRLYGNTRRFDSSKRSLADEIVTKLVGLMARGRDDDRLTLDDPLWTHLWGSAGFEQQKRGTTGFKIPRADCGVSVHSFIPDLLATPRGPETPQSAQVIDCELWGMPLQVAAYLLVGHLLDLSGVPAAEAVLNAAKTRLSIEACTRHHDKLIKLLFPAKRKRLFIFGAQYDISVSRVPSCLLLFAFRWTRARFHPLIFNPNASERAWAYLAARGYDKPSDLAVKAGLVQLEVENGTGGFVTVVQFPGKCDSEPVRNEAVEGISLLCEAAGLNSKLVHVRELNAYRLLPGERDLVFRLHAQLAQRKPMLSRAATEKWLERVFDPSGVAEWGPTLQRYLDEGGYYGVAGAANENKTRHWEQLGYSVCFAELVMRSMSLAPQTPYTHFALPTLPKKIDYVWDPAAAAVASSRSQSCPTDLIGRMLSFGESPCVNLAAARAAAAHYVKEGLVNVETQFGVHKGLVNAVLAEDRERKAKRKIPTKQQRTDSMLSKAPPSRDITSLFAKKPV